MSRWRGERGDAVSAGLPAGGFRLEHACARQVRVLLAGHGTAPTGLLGSPYSLRDIDKNGEAQLPSLVAGDAVRYSVNSGTTTIDKLHAGDETKNLPGGSSATTSGYGA